MRFIYENKAELGGIYRIVNTTNGRIYIGSTSCFRKRAKGHYNDLLANRHLNAFLQNDWNKCGSDAFEFEVVEVVFGAKEVRLEREQHFIDQFYDYQKNCYNLVKEAQDNRGGTRNKQAINPETDGRCKTPSSEVLAKRSEGIKKAMQSPEYRAACAQRAKEIRWKDHSANIIVVNLSTGEIVTIEGSLRQWCLDRGLSYKSFHLLVKGKVKSSGGWCLPTA